MVFFLKNIARICFPMMALVGVLCLTPANSLQAAPDALPPAVMEEIVSLPRALGEIVYQTNAGSPFQVFIIANSHRSAVTGANGTHTLQAQVETYRIGEWLIRQHQVELLLPEGFFGRKGKEGRTADGVDLLDGTVLEAMLADTSTFVNADLLLHQNYGIGLHQVEDRELYRNIRESLNSGMGAGELEYLQERRSAAILQSIPAAMEESYRQGYISAPKAMLTIGMAHLDEMLRFLEEGEIRIAAADTAGSALPSYNAALELVEKGIGVTVIVPRAILENRDMLRMAKLDLSVSTESR